MADRAFGHHQPDCIRIILIGIPASRMILLPKLPRGSRIQGEGHRLNLDLNYNLQTLTYADNTDRNNINHRLRAGADSELIRDHFFIDGFASLDQELVDRRDSASSDNISGADNLRDVQTYSINPRWEQRLGNIANATVRYGHDQVKSEGSRTDSRNQSGCRQCQARGGV